jgi:hypothetical protein
VNGKLFEYGEPDQLYLNDGSGHFTPVSWTNGAFLDEDGKPLTAPPMDWGLAAAFRDLNGDGAPDLYVCNDYWSPDRIWINDGHGKFRAIERLSIRHTSASSMGVDFADVTRSGRMDFFVVDMLSRDPRLRNRQMWAQTPVEMPIGAIDNRPQIMRNTLSLNRGDGTFAEVAEYAGLAGSEWSWSPVFIDVDLDGYEDLLITSGHVKDVQDLDAAAQIEARERQSAGAKRSREEFIQAKIENARFYPRLETPIVAFRNLGNLRFQEMTTNWGTAAPGVHHAIAMADFDGDGDLDFVVNNLGSAAAIYRNDTSAPRVMVRLNGAPPNMQGIGAAVTLMGGAVPAQMQEIASGGHYMSGSEACLVFAANRSSTPMQIKVRWRNGETTELKDVRANRCYEIDEQNSPTISDQQGAAPSPPALFEDVSHLIAHEHHEEPFNDYQRQPLLPRKLSQLGPGVAWFDLDSDGWEDLVIGSGKGGALAVFKNDGKGGFQRVAGYTQPVARDQTGIVVYNAAPGRAAILTASANYEDGLSSGASVKEYTPSGALTDLVAGMTSSAGALAMADIDGDGDLDLFVGGAVIPARYPEPASSRVYVNENGTFKLQQELVNVGLVRGAVWSDLDEDGFPDLILACEWGPIRVFHNNKGKLDEVTAPLGFAKYIGWWTGVTVGDFDGDGKMDIAAANWGLNSPYKPVPDRSIRLYYGDFMMRNAVDLVEAEWDAEGRAEIPRRNRHMLGLALPDLAQRFPTHYLFSQASIEQVLGPSFAQAKQVEANFLNSAVFLNRGDHFELSILPMEAQLAPAFAVNVADFDGDGHEDLFLSQNFFANAPDIPRADAGRGLILLGDGAGGFKALSGAESGLKIYGEQRGAAVCDFDHDGRTDLVVTQNGAKTVLLRNTRGSKGLRVKLNGAPANPQGFGATIRIKASGKLGPARQVSAGSGYFSQDGSCEILTLGSNASECIVTWPGGKKTSIPLASGSLEATVYLSERGSSNKNN